jgi:hypothetical protein
MNLSGSRNRIYIPLPAGVRATCLVFISFSLSLLVQPTPRDKRQAIFSPYLSAPIDGTKSNNRLFKIIFGYPTILIHIVASIVIERNSLLDEAVLYPE